MPPTSSKSSEVKREVRATFDFISKDYDKLRSRVWEDLTNFTTESLFTPRPSRNSLLLDLACGNARHAIYFTEKYEISSVAIDFSTQLLKLGKNRVKVSKLERAIALINGDSSYIPLRNSSINEVLYIAAIHHLPTTSERLTSMREISRILGVKGRAVVTVWRKWQRRFALHFAKKQLRHPLGGKVAGELGDIYVPWKCGHGAESVSRFYHLFSKRELARLISESGFRTVRISKSSKKAAEGSYFASVEKK
jgi:ubiquinone/menaquinone biosynthesis C-methylase UbiE